jgi:hypothetical protein
MYTPFEGEAFFAAYDADRLDALADLSLRCVGGVLPAPLARAMTPALDALAAPAIPFSTPHSTIAALRTARLAAAQDDSDPMPADLSAPIETVPCLNALLTAADNDATTAGPWLEFFIHRYEVAKRIRADYNREHGLGAPLTDPAPYALLAAALGLACRQTVDHKYLNTLFKLGDLLSSARSRAETANTAGLCAAALVLERLAFNNLMQRQGLGL